MSRRATLSGSVSLIVRFRGLRFAAEPAARGSGLTPGYFVNPLRGFPNRLLPSAYCLLFLSTSRPNVHRAAGEVALAVGEAELLLLQLGGDDVNLPLAEGAGLRLIA